jgi:hypothetical protein
MDDGGRLFPAKSEGIYCFSVRVIRLFALFVARLSLLQKNIVCAAIANETSIKINFHQLNVKMKLKLLDH